VELSEGAPGVLRHDLQHHPYRDISDHVTSIDHYTTLAAEEWASTGRQTGVLDVVFHPPAAFLRNYVLRGGFRDGMAGFLISVLNSYYVFLKILKLWEIQCGLHGPLRAEPGGRRRKFERAPNADRQSAVGNRH
jgi:hypothetical protein